MSIPKRLCSNILDPIGNRASTMQSKMSQMNAKIIDSANGERWIGSRERSGSEKHGISMGMLFWKLFSGAGRHVEIWPKIS